MIRHILVVTISVMLIVTILITSGCKEGPGTESVNDSLQNKQEETLIETDGSDTETNNTEISGTDRDDADAALIEAQRRKLSEKYPLSSMKYDLRTYEVFAGDPVKAVDLYKKDPDSCGKPEETELTVNILGNDYTGTYSESNKNIDGEIFDIYKVESDQFAEHPKFSVIRSDKRLRSFSFIPVGIKIDEIRTEEQLIDQVKTLLTGYKDVTGYEYGVNTSLDNTSLGYSRNYDDFHAPEEGERLSTYVIGFIKPYCGYGTTDQFSVTVFGFGGVMLSYVITGNPCDDETVYEKAAAFACQDENVVKEFIEANLYEEYELVSFERIHNTLACLDGKPAVIANVHYSFKYKGASDTSENGEDLLMNGVSSILITLSDEGDTSGQVMQSETEPEVPTEEQAALMKKYPVKDMKYSVSDYESTAGVSASPSESYYREPFKDSTVPKEFTATILGVEYTADYDDSMTELDSSITDHYRRGKIGDYVTLSVRRGDKELVGFIISKTTDMLTFETEEQLLETVDAYLPGSIDRSQYVCQILTGYAEVSEYGVEKKAELGFRRMTAEDREPVYEVHLIKDYYGFPTGDQIRFVISGESVFFRRVGDPNPDGFYEKAAALALQDKEIVEEYMRSSFEKNPDANLVKIQRISNILLNCDGKPAVLAKVRCSAVSTVEPVTDADGNAVPYEDTVQIVLIPETE